MAKLWLVLSLIASNSFGITTKYFAFDHPDGWECENPEKVMWICQAATDPDRKEALVLAMPARATDWDTIENYETYLKQTRTLQDEDNATHTSEVRYVRRRNINGHEWVDSLQLNSELPGFWTRYVATVNDTPVGKIAILITYVVSEERYKQLAPVFERMISSLKPNAEVNLNMASRQGDSPLPGSDRLGPMGNIIADRLGRKNKPTTDTAAPAPGGDMSLLFIAGGIAAIAVLFLRIRKRKAIAKRKEPVPANPPRKVS